ncbi:MAG TPA: bifunctional 5,10-methylenetetrahydrofolate dehydrogenase/5,10-methenyltetrahydrofolate cyclohydrolase [Candidatus Kapabacteria bacterium]|nr:bifunctional 5,10-methylenetetrahydrofolate dehydrogenase/5,10-methenyltetrahydrofolate cyclohydrolase [Candidatus Kapabacteria bacterium]
MENKLIEGKIVSDFIKEDLKIKTAELKQTKNITPCLAVMLVGEDPASKVYVNGKIKACEEIGYKSIVKELPDTTMEKEILSIIDEWNENPEIHGILVQLPLPHQINETKVLLKIKPSKDVDGFHPENVGRLVAGLPGFISCTPAGIIELMKFYKINPSSADVVIIGRSNIVGKPILNLLYQKKEYANATVTICHTATKNLQYYTKNADILIAAMGSPRFIKGDFVKDGVIVFDVGVNRIPDPTKKSGYKLVGDVDFDEVFPKASKITPVPGGVGPLTIAMLMTNTFKSANQEYNY